MQIVVDEGGEEEEEEREEAHNTDLYPHQIHKDNPVCYVKDNAQCFLSSRTVDV